MSDIQAEHFGVVPHRAVRGPAELAQHRQNMLVLSGASAMVIVVVAALFMTMF